MISLSTLPFPSITLTSISRYRMLTFADPSGRRTAVVALRNSLYLIPLGFIAYDWGVTSGWFCLESSLLTLAISAAAFAFYRNRTAQKARRMFHASLLYLPVFMSGLILHRVTDIQQDLVQDNTDTDKIVDLSSSLGALEHENENVGSQNKARWPAAWNQAKSPVAYASVAPFPFLPAPIYSAD